MRACAPDRARTRRGLPRVRPHRETPSDDLARIEQALEVILYGLEARVAKRLFYGFDGVGKVLEGVLCFDETTLERTDDAAVLEKLHAREGVPHGDVDDRHFGV